MRSVLTFNTLYTVSGIGLGRTGKTFMVQMSDDKKEEMIVMEGDFPNPPIGCVRTLQTSNANGPKYSGFTQAFDDFLELDLRRDPSARGSAGSVMGDQFLIQLNSITVGVMRRGLSNSPTSHAQSFGIRFLSDVNYGPYCNVMNPRTKALILAAGIQLFDYHFMETNRGIGGIRRTQRLSGCQRFWSHCFIVILVLVIIAAGFVVL